MTEYAIRARGVARRYGTMQALTGVDLDVQRGEIFAVLGPNGAGKTTFIEILEGLRRRDVGTVNVLGEDPSDGRRSWRARIGGVLQLGTETDEITVREMVEAFSAYYPNPLPATELLEALDLTEQQDRKVRQLSGGQRRRLDLALGMIGNPELLFLDEPTTGLDPEVRRRIWQFVTMLAERGMTIVLTTHYLEEAEQLADRVAVLVAGQIVTTGRPEEITGTTQSMVSFRPTGALATATLPDGLPATSVSKSNGRTVLTTADPTALVTALVAWAAATPGGELQDLQIERRDLEQAYLDLLTNLDPKEVSA